MKVKLYLPLFLALIIGCAHAANSDLSEALSSIRKKYDLPGLAAALAVNGDITRIVATGLRKIGNRAELKTSDKFHLGSCSKAMTATLAATFIEEGKITWKTKLSEIFPELNLNPAFKKITFDELLAHRSGLAKDPSDKLYEQLQKQEPSETRLAITKIFLEKAPAHRPLTFNYSNIGYIIVGHILEKISGKTWEMLMVERIFSPLDMTSCGFGATSDPSQTSVTQPWGHERQYGIMTPIHFDNAPFYGPAATVHCSLNDWNKFLTIHIQGFNGVSNLLTPKSFRKLHTPYPESGETYTYGAWIRLRRNWGNGPVLTHAGSNMVNLANVWLAPKKKAALMSTSNAGDWPALNATDDAITELFKYLQ